MERLICDDCLRILPRVPNNSIDCVITDPPYVLETRGAGLFRKKHMTYTRELETMSNGFSTAVLDELVRVMKKINIYLFCSQKQLPVLYRYFVKEHHCNWNLLTWHKTNPVPACGNHYLVDTEYVFFAREKGVRIMGSYATKKTYFVTPTNQKEKKRWGHPTIKPVSILNNFIVNSCPVGGGSPRPLLWIR